MNSGSRVSLRWTSLLLIALILIVAFFSLTNDGGRAQIAVLQQTIERLEHKIGGLEYEVRKIESKVAELGVSRQSDPPNVAATSDLNSK